MNILVLSCGTRNMLVQYMKECKAIDKVIATDCSEEAPALYEADAYYIVPSFYEDTYIEEILAICKKESISLMVVLQEEEVLLMAKYRDFFKAQGIYVAVSSYEMVVLCKDKYELNRKLLQEGIPAVETHLPPEGYALLEKNIPVFIKPRYGAGSVSTLSASSLALGKAYIEENQEDMVIQPRVEGKEYGVDVYVDLFSGEIKAIFCKEKLRMRGGETDKSISVKNVQIENLVYRILEKLPLVGPIDMDILEHQGEYYLLEINPRFGGGYPHAEACGISFMEKLACNGKGRENMGELPDYPEGIVAMKYASLALKR